MRTPGRRSSSSWCWRWSTWRPRSRSSSCRSIRSSSPSPSSTPAGNILSVIVSAIFLRRLLGHLDGPRIASSYIRMGYAALGSALAGAVALWLLGSYNPDGYAWSDRPAALVTIVVVGPVMLAAYFLLLKLFRVTELQDLLQPLLGRLRRGPAAGPRHAEPQAGGAAEVRGTGAGHRLGGYRPDSANLRRVRRRVVPRRSRHPGRGLVPLRAVPRPGGRLPAGRRPPQHRAGRLGQGRCSRCRAAGPTRARPATTPISRLAGKRKNESRLPFRTAVLTRPGQSIG